MDAPAPTEEATDTAAPWQGSGGQGQAKGQREASGAREASAHASRAGEGDVVLDRNHPSGQGALRRACALDAVLVSAGSRSGCMADPPDAAGAASDRSIHGARELGPLRVASGRL